jgi:hypothetical protein
VLEQHVKNEKFRAWLDRELDGYDQIEDTRFDPPRGRPCHPLCVPHRVFRC